MAMKFYNVEKVAEILGITPADVNEMRERQELHGYRDGADWKFKAEQIDQLAAARAAAGTPADASDDANEDDVLLSEVELGQSDPSTSGTIIGPPPSEALGSSLSGFEDLDLTMADSGLDMSALDMSSVSNLTGASELDLNVQDLDDDDLVLGAGSSGGGSDLTIGGDSGISLLDPSDSGISLEEPLNLDSAVSGDSLDLDQGQVLATDKPAPSDVATELGTDSDFMLTPMDELTDGDEDSSSQVIALDEEGDSSDELLGVAPALGGDFAEPLGPEISLGDDDAVAGAMPLEIPGAALSMTPGATMADYGAAVQPAGGGSAALPEAPYSTLNILGLAFCVIVLFLVGMMMFDLMRNMWSWNQPTAVNSWLMDLILRR